MQEKVKEKSRRRRNDVARMKERARRVVCGNEPARGFVMYNLDGSLVSREEWVEDCAVRCANNMAKCSCAMCGNPRHRKYSKGSERLTMQERRQLQDGDLYEEE